MNGDTVLTFVMLGLLVWVAIQDLIDREIYTVTLWALLLVCLLGQPWYWWVLTVATMAWPFPRRSGLALSPALLCVGVLAGPDGMPPALALAAGVTAWSLSWWESGDVVVLLAMGLRYGLVGLIVGTVFLSLSGLALMLIRGRSLRTLVAIARNALVERRLPSLARDGDDGAAIPDDAEMPAAAVLAVIGVVMELGMMTVSLS